MSRNLVKEIEQLNHQIQMIGMSKEQKKKYKEKLTNEALAGMWEGLYGNPFKK